VQGQPFSVSTGIAQQRVVYLERIVTGHAELLRSVAEQLFTMARQSENGGWSTHQTETQRKLAGRICEHLAVNGL